MNIKKMMAGLMAGAVMLGTLSTTCFAATAEPENAETNAAVNQSATTTASGNSATNAGSAAANTTANAAENAADGTNANGTTTDGTSADSTADADEALPYTVEVDEDGNYTFSFGDWEWSTADTEDDGTAAKVNSKVTSYLNLRSGSGLEYEVIGHLLPGAEVQVISDEGDWYQVTVPEQTGYVYKDYIDLMEAEESSGQVDEEFMTMMLYLMMNSMNQTETTSQSLTPDGNLTLVDDIGSSTGAGQQFITLVTKDGNYFYLIIDRDDDGDENVHFLNLVDEQDLFALLDEDEQAAYTSSTTAVVDEDITKEVTEEESDDTDAAEAEVTTEKKSTSMLPLLLVVVLIAGAGGGYFYLQTRKKKAAVTKPDPDADYTEEDEDEYELPMEEDDDYSDEPDADADPDEADEDLPDDED